MSRLLKVVLIIVVVFVLIGLLVPYVVSVDRYRPQIEAEVQKQTGRKLELGGLRARLLPSVGFTIEKVTLGPPAGFAPVDLLTADTIRGSIAFFALLHGDVEVTSIEIVKPDVVLATDEHGKTNYDFSTPGAGKKPAADPGSSASSPVKLDSLSISDASISMVDVRGGKPKPPSVKLTGVNVEFSNLDLSPQGMANWEGKVPLSGMKVELAGAPPVSFRSGEVKIAKGAVNGNCEIELTDVGRVKGDFSVPNVQKLMAAAPSAHSEQVGTGKFTSDKLRSAPYELTNVSMDTRIFSDHVEAPITAAAYGGSINVNAKVEFAATPAKMSANIQVSQLDVEKVLAADPSTRGKATGHAELKLQVAAPLNGNLMNAMTGQGNFTLRDGKLPGVDFGKSMAELGKLEKVLSLGTSGGTPSGEVTFSQVQGDLDIHGGRVYTNKTHADSNMGSGDIKGSVGFDQTLDLTGSWALPKGSRTGAATAGAVGAAALTGGLLAPALLGAGGAALSVPFTVKGTFKDPKVTPGGGFPGFKSGSSDQSSSSQQPQQKKKVLGIFGKP